MPGRTPCFRINTRSQKGYGSGMPGTKTLWFCGIVGTLLVVGIALMIASRDQPANASLDLWSAEMMVGKDGQTVMR